MCWKHRGSKKVNYFQLKWATAASDDMKEFARSIWYRTVGDYVCVTCLKNRVEKEKKENNKISVEETLKILGEI